MYYVVSEDATKFKIEGKKTAILNSLGKGEGLSLPGAMFRSILEGCKKPKALLREVVAKGECLSYSEVFETKSFGLPCDGIIHAITPYADRDNEKLSKLEETYRSALRLAKESGYQAILLIALGSGANGYETIDSFNLEKKVASSFARRNPEIDVYVNVYSLERSDFGEESLCLEERKLIRCDVCEAVSSFSERSYGENVNENHVSLDSLEPEIEENETLTAFLDRYIIRNFVGPVDPENLTFSQKRIVRQYWDVIDQNLGSLPVKKNGATAISPGPKKDSKEKNRLRNRWKDNYGKPNKKGPGWAVPEKYQVLLIGFSLRMSRADVMFLFRFCGYYLNYWNKKDAAYMRCMEDIEKKDGILLMYNDYFDAFGESMFA